MGQTGDLFSRFKPASTAEEHFFENFRRSKDETSLRRRIEDILGPLADAAFEYLKPLAERNFQEAIESFFEHGLPDLARSPVSYRERPSPREDTPGSEDTPGLEGTAAPEGAPGPQDTPEVKNTSEPEIGYNAMHGDTSTPPLLTQLRRDCASETLAQSSGAQNTNQGEDRTQAPSTQWSKRRRLIGSFQCDAWCTRSGRNFAKYGEVLRVGRIPSASSAAGTGKHKEDNIVRLYNSEGLDFARSREEDARFMSVLIDSGVCVFEAAVIFADTHLRLGSTINVQMDCYLTSEAFASSSSFGVGLDQRPKKKKGIVDESRETQEERLIRLRQAALVNLFNRVGLTDMAPDMNQALSGMNASAASRGPDDEEGHELNQDQLDLFYRTTDSSAKNVGLDEKDPDASFALDLFPYQKRGLAWMLQRETSGMLETSGDSEQGETHPLWTQLSWPEGDPFWANLNSGELSIRRPTLETKSRGGILADEMGLGKTISMLALVHSGVNEVRGHTTLVVAPMSLLSQWESEIQKVSRTPNSCSCFVYYGVGTTQLRDNLSMFFDAKVPVRKVVVTSYGMVISEHKQRHLFRGTLFDREFDRIILDEAHTIKNRSTQTAKACFDLNGQRRWVLTGTPVVNRLEDLYSLVRFIGVEPWDNFIFWRAFITEQFEKQETRERAMNTVQAVVLPICLRRTKGMRDPATGRPLVELPSKIIEVKRIAFSSDEQTLYSHLYAQIRESVQDKVLEGTASTKYSAILALLLRLRQVCCHPLLLRKAVAGETANQSADLALAAIPPNTKRVKREDETLELPAADLRLDLTADAESLLDKFTATPSVEYTVETLKSLLQRSLEDEECVICSENQTEPVILECLHSACRDCLMCHIDHLKQRGDEPLCHICRAPISQSRMFVVNKEAKRLQPLNMGIQSSKIRALVTDLRQAFAQGVGKAVVFSQFTAFLDIIQTNLEEAGFPVYRFDGSLSQAQRTAAVEGFKVEPRQNAVFLLSLKAGGVGLNLVVAKHAYLMDPWWSYAVESQAIDRIHRMGQTDAVKVTRFIIEGSIEERMLKIQERKRALSSVVSEDERRAEQLENIKLLLDLPEIKEPTSALKASP